MKRVGTVALTALLAIAAPVAAQAAPEDPLDRFERTDSERISSTVKPAAADANARVTVMVELEHGPGRGR